MDSVSSLVCREVTYITKLPRWRIRSWPACEPVALIFGWWSHFSCFLNTVCLGAACCLNTRGLSQPLSQPLTLSRFLCCKLSCQRVQMMSCWALSKELWCYQFMQSSWAIAISLILLLLFSILFFFFRYFTVASEHEMHGRMTTLTHVWLTHVWLKDSSHPCTLSSIPHEECID